MAKSPKQYPGIIARNESALQITIPYMGIKIYETMPLSNTAPNRLKCFEKRCVIIKELKEGKFDYKKHFPLGKNQSRFARMSGDHITISERLTTYKNEILNDKTMKTTTRKCYLRDIKKLDKIFGNRMLSSITRKDLTNWAKKCNVVQKTLNNRLRHWHVIIADAMLNGDINNNILDGWKPIVIKKSTHEKEPFSIKEYKKIMAAMKTVAPEMYSLTMFRFALGMRPSEIYGLTWSRYNELKQTITIIETLVDNHHEDKTKTPSGTRTLKLNEPALKAIMIQKELTYNDGGFVFVNPNTNRAWTYRCFGTRWDKALKLADVDWRTPYNTRHTFATQAMLSKKTELYALSLALGHADMSTTSRAYVGSNSLLNESDTSAVNDIFNIDD